MASCYRCQVITGGAGEGIGVCDMCVSLACDVCGARLPVSKVFRCGICYPNALVIAAGLPPAGGGGSGGGGGGGAAAGGGRPAPQPEFRNVDEFELYGGGVAEDSRSYRESWRKRLPSVLGSVEQMAHEEDLSLHERQIASRLTREIQTARELGTLQEELLADAFGVAAWAIVAEPGAVVDRARTALLADERLRFVLDHANGEMTASAGW